MSKGQRERRDTRYVTVGKTIWLEPKCRKSLRKHAWGKIVCEQSCRARLLDR